MAGTDAATAGIATAARPAGAAVSGLATVAGAGMRPAANRRQGAV